MHSNQAQASDITVLLAPQSAANTASATSSWIDVRNYEGDLMFSVQTGIVTAGQIAWSIEDADDNSGTAAAAVTPNEGAFTTVTTANDPLTEKRTIAANAVRRWVRLVGTITTGPALVGAALIATPKYAD